MIEQGQIWTNGKQKFEVLGFEPSGNVLLFGHTQVDYLNLDDHGKREIPPQNLEAFLQKEMIDFKPIPKS